jgi:hypothetical protein
MPDTSRSRSKTPPNGPERDYLRLGLSQPGRKLPLFDEDGQPVKPDLIRRCLAMGWAERWFSNPLAPDWLVCRLTERGIQALEKSAAAVAGD